MGLRHVRVTVGAHGVVWVCRGALVEEGSQHLACSCRSKELRKHKTLHWSPWRWEHVLETKLVLFSFHAKENKCIFLPVAGSYVLRVCRSLLCSVHHLRRNSFPLECYLRPEYRHAGVSDCCFCFLIYRYSYMWHLSVSLKAICLPQNTSPNDCCRK